MLREVAGERFAAIELNYGIPYGHPHRGPAAGGRAARACSGGRGRQPKQILADPYLLIGTVEHIVETLQRRREQFGISYVQVYFQDIDTFAPVVARLAGK